MKETKTEVKKAFKQIIREARKHDRRIRGSLRKEVLRKDSFLFTLTISQKTGLFSRSDLIKILATLDFGEKQELRIVVHYLDKEASHKFQKIIFDHLYKIRSKLRVLIRERKDF
jgi:DNA-binding transcriptional regulator PaaX